MTSDLASTRLTCPADHQWNPPAPKLRPYRLATEAAQKQSSRQIPYQLLAFCRSNNYRFSTVTSLRRSIYPIQDFSPLVMRKQQIQKSMSLVSHMM
ncbi:hypothetical protein AVEN_123978-1 [Araneus ventricosus]|uniref:Uncharacterized protein n=1 Tax=Araneus ventricosus TaxID=182803 RepID=A0A4Y2D9U8_ARAVE|nr:hypothetical protein AVEN_123978-1 [Araneus ventricosus]